MPVGIFTLLFGILGVVQYIWRPVFIDIGSNNIIWFSLYSVVVSFLIIFSIISIVVGVLLIILIKTGKIEESNSMSFILFIQLFCLIVSVI